MAYTPISLKEALRESDAYLADHPQFYGRHAFIPIHRTKENTMYDDPNCCPSAPETTEQSAKRLRKQAEQFEARAKAERKAQKKAAREEQQRRDDVALAIDTFAEIASDGDAYATARIEAARNLLAAHGENYANSSPF